MARCEQVSFWVAGMKVRSGEAVAHLPHGELKVVCRKAKAGEINVQELPTGTLLRVPSVGYFAFDADRWRGRLGRTTDVKDVLERLQGQAKLAYLNRVVASRSDREAATAVLKVAGSWALPSRKAMLAMLRRNPSLAAPVVEIGCTDPKLNYIVASYLDAVSDPVVLHHAMTFVPPEDHMTQLAESAAKRLSELGFHRDAGRWLLSQLAQAPDRRHAYSFYPVVQSFPDHYIGEFATALLTDRNASGHFVEMLGDTIVSKDLERTVTRAGILKEVVMALPQRPWMRNEADTIKRFLQRCDEALSTPFRTKTHQGINWGSLSDEDLLATFVQERNEPFFDERYAAVEISKRPLPSNPTMNDPSVFWATALRRTGRFSEEELVAQLHNTATRVEAMAHFNERQLRRAVDIGHAPAPVLLEALRRLDDIELWERFTVFQKDKYLRRWVAEHAPDDVLKLLTTRNAGMSEGALSVWEVAVGRNLLDPLQAASHASPVVRRIAARRAASHDVSAILLSDPDPSVRRAATRHCRDIALLQKHLDAGVSEVDDLNRPLQDAFTRRIRQLEHYELAKATAVSETVIARAALPLIKDRALLLELIQFEELAPFIAPEVERIVYKPPRN